jgi:crossover junction endodeoxyribonuclease RuvC
MPVVVGGLDLSLTGTGIAVFNHRQRLLAHGSPKTRPEDGCRELRIDMILTSIQRIFNEFELDLVMIEDYAHSRPTAQSTLGEVGGVVKRWLWLREIPFDTLSSQTLKLWTTGYGRASKPEMIEASRPWYDGRDDNVADAVHLARWGLDHFDEIVVPA